MEHTIVKMVYKKKYGQRKTTKKRSKKGASFEKRVKQVVEKAAELKVSGGNPAAYTFPADNNTVMTPVSLLATAGGTGAISLGTAQGSRIGNRINVKKATLKFIASAQPTNAIPTVLQIFIGTLKGNKQTVPSSADLALLYQDGGTATTVVDPSRLSLLRSVNRDLFNIDRYMKIKLAPANNASLTSNNDYKYTVMKTINLRSLLGTWIFDDSTTNDPTNKDLYIWAHWIDMSNGNIDSVPPVLEYYTTIEYTDL